MLEQSSLQREEDDGEDRRPADRNQERHHDAEKEVEYDRGDEQKQSQMKLFALHRDILQNGYPYLCGVTDAGATSNRVGTIGGRQSLPRT